MARVGPHAFSYKAEIGFDGTYLAAKLMRRYENEFIQLTMKPSPQVNSDNSLEDLTQGHHSKITSISTESSSELKLLLAWYAEDVIRTVENEVKLIESLIRKSYPQAIYIELEPDSKIVSPVNKSTRIVTQASSNTQSFDRNQYQLNSVDNTNAELFLLNELDTTMESDDMATYAIDDATNDKSLRKQEIETLNKFQKIF